MLFVVFFFLMLHGIVGAVEINDLLDFMKYTFEIWEVGWNVRVPGWDVKGKDKF